MRDGRFPMDRGAVESMQHDLEQNEPAILASYRLTGAILLFGGAGFAADHYFATSPWCVLAGLLAGLGIGLYELAGALRR
jgi:F0F1-type ATP synthase assembly protein I